MDGEGVLSRGRIHLVPVSLVPVESLYQVASLSGASSTWRTRGRTPGIDQFGALLLDSGESAFAVVDGGRAGAVVGFVGLYRVDPVSLVGCLSAFFDTRLPDVGYIVGTAVHQFCRHCFEVVGLRKLTVERPGRDATDLDAALAWGDVLTKEGILERQVRLGQRYEDLHIYAVWADRYLARYAPSRRGSGSPAIGIDQIATMIEKITGEPMTDLTGGHRLIDDVGLDSLSLLEVLDLLETLAGCQIDLDPIDDGSGLTVEHLLDATERALLHAVS